MDKYLVIVDTSYYPEVHGPYDFEFAQATYEDKADYQAAVGQDAKVYMVKVLDSSGVDQ